MAVLIDREAEDAVAELAAEVFADFDASAWPSPAAGRAPVDPSMDRSLWRSLAQTGLLGSGIDSAYGGGGAGFAATVRLLVAAGASLARVPLLETVVTGAYAISEFGDDELRSRLLPGIVDGSVVITSAFATGGALSLDDDLVSGLCDVVPYVRDADYLVALIGDRVVLVPLEGSKISDQTPTSGEPHGRVEFESCPAVVLAGAERLAALTNVGVSAICAGIGEKALSLTAEYVSQRRQFGHPLATFQAVATQAADRYVDLRAMNATLRQAVRALTEPEFTTATARDVAAARVWAADGVRRITATAQHLHGGFGVDVGYVLHRYHAWARYWELYGGSAASWTAALGDLLAAEQLEEE